MTKEALDLCLIILIHSLNSNAIGIEFPKHCLRLCIMKKILIVLLLPTLICSMCKKDYYTGTENVRLLATINNENETLNLGDTLKIKLVIPPILISESGVSTNVSSVQRGLYSFVFYKLDTVTKTVTRITDNASIFMSKGTIDVSLANVYTSIVSSYESILNIKPPSKGIYYIQVTGLGSIKVNGNYEAFLKVNFNVLNKHWDMYSTYIPGYSSSPDIIRYEADGYGTYCLRVY